MGRGGGIDPFSKTSSFGKKGDSKAPSENDGNWKCPQCNNINWKWRTECNKCHAAPPPGVVIDNNPLNKKGKKRLDVLKANVISRFFWKPIV